MTGEFFSDQMIKLTETFGKGAYSPPRVNAIWAAVKNSPEAWFASVVDNMIGSLRQAPLPADFIEACMHQRHKAASEEIQNRDIKAEWDKPTNCTYCKDSGVFLCSHRQKPGPWAFRCACPKGRADLRTAIPFFVQGHHDQGFRFDDVERTA